MTSAAPPASSGGEPGHSPAVHAARVLLQALVDLGVREVVLSPGSRSAPLAYAVAEAAGASGGAAGGPGAGRDTDVPGVDLHVRIDERSAGFLALGLAKGARADGHPRPVAVVTTSGTAVANLHPAVLEAHHGGLPLLLLTADRPHELRGVGANQTTDQVGLLAPAVRLGVDVPAPTGRPGEDRDLRHVAARAVAAARGSRTGDPGPVHLNLAFREPLVPDGGGWPERSRDGLVEVAARGAAGGPPAASATPAGPAAQPAAVVLSADPATSGVLGPDGVRTVVVAGDGAGPLAGWVARANDWPLLAEPSSGARGGPNAIGAYRLLLGEPALADQVQRVVVLGRPTLSRQVHALLARPDVQTLVIAPDGAGWPDAARNAEQVLAEVPPNLLRGNLGRGVTVVPGSTGPTSVAGSGAGWLSTWQRAGNELGSRIRGVAGTTAGGEQRADPGPGGAGVAGPGRDGAGLDGAALGSAGGGGAGLGNVDEVLTGPAVAVAVADATGPWGGSGSGSRSVAVDVLVVGSSNPVRDLDLVAQWDESPLVLANRGLAGIDGTVSTAAGVALSLGHPVRVLVGDLTFLHDVGGLLVGPLERRPDLQIVVANDGGGSIFAGLEHGEPQYAGVFERVFGTPHGADLAALCAGYGVGHASVTDVEALLAALAEPVRGISVVEARVDRSGRRALAARLAESAAQVVVEVLGSTD